MKQWVWLFCFGNLLVLSFAGQNGVPNIDDDQEDYDHLDGGSTEEAGSMEKVDKHDIFPNPNATRALELSDRRTVSKNRGKQQMWKMMRREMREMMKVLPKLASNISWMDMDVKVMNKNYYTLVGDVRIIKAEVSMIKSLAYKLWKNVSDTVSDHPKIILALWWILNNMTEVGEEIGQTSKSMSNINESYSKVIKKLQHTSQSLSGFQNSLDGMSSEFNDIRETLRSGHANTSSSLDMTWSLLQTIFVNYNTIAQNVVYLVQKSKDILSNIDNFSNMSEISNAKIIFTSESTRNVTIEIRETVKESNKYLGSFDNRLSSMNGDINGMTTLIIAFDKRFFDMNAEISVMNKLIGAIDQRLESMDTGNNTADVIITALVHHFSSLNGDIRTMWALIAVIEKHVKSVNDEVILINTWLIKYDEHLRILNVKVTAIKKELGGFDQRLSSLTGSVATIQSNMHSLDKNLRDVRGHVASIDNQVGAMNNTVSNMDQKLIAMDTKIDIVHSDVNRLDSRIQNFSAHLSTIQGQCGNIDFLTSAVYATHDNVGRLGQHLSYTSEEIKIAMGILKDDLDTVKEKLRDIRNVMSVPYPTPRPHDIVTDRPLVNFTTPFPWWLTTLPPYPGGTNGFWQSSRPSYRPPQPEAVNGIGTLPSRWWETTSPYPPAPHPPLPTPGWPSEPSDHLTTTSPWAFPDNFAPTMTMPSWMPTDNVPPLTDRTLINGGNDVPPTVTLPSWMPIHGRPHGAPAHSPPPWMPTRTLPPWFTELQWWQTSSSLLDTPSATPKPWWETEQTTRKPTQPAWAGSPLFTFTAPSTMPHWWPTPGTGSMPSVDSASDSSNESPEPGQCSSPQINCNCSCSLSPEDKKIIKSNNASAFESICPCENRLKDHVHTLFEIFETKVMAALAKQEKMYREMQMQLKESLSERIHAVGYIVSYYATSILHFVNNTRSKGGKAARERRVSGITRLLPPQRHLLDKFLQPPRSQFNHRGKQRIPGIPQSGAKALGEFSETSNPKIKRWKMDRAKKQQDTMLPSDIPAMTPITPETIRMPVVQPRMLPDKMSKKPLKIVKESFNSKKNRKNEKIKKTDDHITTDQLSGVKTRSLPLKNIGSTGDLVDYDDYIYLDRDAEGYDLDIAPDERMEKPESQESVPKDQLSMIGTPLNSFAVHRMLQKYLKNQWFTAIQPDPKYRSARKRTTVGRLHSQSRNRNKLERRPMFSVMSRLPFLTSAFGLPPHMPPLPYPLPIPPILPMPAIAPVPPAIPIPIPLIPSMPPIPPLFPIRQIPPLSDFFASLPLSINSSPYSFSYNDGKGNSWNVNINRRSDHFDTLSLKNGGSRRSGKEDIHEGKIIKETENKPTTETSQETRKEIAKEYSENEERDDSNEPTDRR